ncbi:MAG: hypothetical protein AB1726_05275 [Planctomycetota bacterium]
MIGVAALLLAAVPQDAALPPEPPAFAVREIEGWTAHVGSAALAEHPAEMETALAHLRWQLHQTAQVLPAAALVAVRALPVWVEHETQTACMSFHPARQWLLDHGYSPPEVPSVVEVGNARTFVAWTHEQPWMVLHELAHGFDFVSIGRGERYGEARFDALWQEVVAGGRYEAVRHWAGGEERHYALSNPMEHFAEATEAYFGINDFCPFVRAELREHDPATARAIEERWGVDVAAQRKLEAGLAAALEAEKERPRWPGGLRERAGIARERSAEPSGDAPRGIEEAGAGIPAQPLSPVWSPDVDGWRIDLRGDLAGALAESVRAEIARELHLAGRYLPAAACARLREYGGNGHIDVWSDLQAIPYVDGRWGWPVMGHARNFLAWAAIEPCILIRELSALWYELELSGDPAAAAAVQEALARARSGGRYDSVLRFDGRRVLHPALRDERTFFAEMSEAYFLGNDHFPFVRAELKNHDRATYDLLERLWRAAEEER